MADWAVDEKLLRQTICADDDPADVALFVKKCNQTRLDPFARQIIPMRKWNPDQKRKVMTGEATIDGFRAMAERTGRYRGQTHPQWCGPDGKWVDVWTRENPPSAARCGVHRDGFAEPLYAVARHDSYVQLTKERRPNRSWSQMPDVMLHKCAESLALRKAFPQELSGVYTTDEMGQALNEPLEASNNPPKPEAPAGPPRGANKRPVPPEQPPLPTQRPAAESESPEPQAPASQKPPGPMTYKQRSRLESLALDPRLTNAARDWIKRSVIGQRLNTKDANRIIYRAKKLIEDETGQEYVPYEDTNEADREPEDIPPDPVPGAEPYEVPDFPPSSGDMPNSDAFPGVPRDQVPPYDRHAEQDPDEGADRFREMLKRGEQRGKKAAEPPAGQQTMPGTRDRLGQ